MDQSSTYRPQPVPEPKNEGLDWMRDGKMSAAMSALLREEKNCHRTGGGEEQPDGVALPPHERDCGRSHPMRGTNSEDLTEWCIEHET